MVVVCLYITIYALTRNLQTQAQVLSFFLSFSESKNTNFIKYCGTLVTYLKDRFPSENSEELCAQASRTLYISIGCTGSKQACFPTLLASSTVPVLSMTIIIIIIKYRIVPSLFTQQKHNTAMSRVLFVPRAKPC